MEIVGLKRMNRKDGENGREGDHFEMQVFFDSYFHLYFVK